MVEKIRSLICSRKINNPFENRVSLHFLLNSLNCVVSLCRKKPESAAELVVEISTYLRKSLEDKAFLITLDEELEHVFSYINIQKTRFQDRLKIVPDIEDNLQCLIPAFTLQPIVDNAIRHGVLKRRQGGTVILKINRSPHSVRVSVTDDGVGMSAEESGPLLERRNRRHSMYRVNKALKAAGSKGLSVDSSHSSGTRVTFELPSIYIH